GLARLPGARAEHPEQQERKHDGPAKLERDPASHVPAFPRPGWLCTCTGTDSSRCHASVIGCSTAAVAPGAPNGATGAREEFARPARPFLHATTCGSGSRHARTRSPSGASSVKGTGGSVPCHACCCPAVWSLSSCSPVAARSTTIVSRPNTRNT